MTPISASSLIPACFNLYFPYLKLFSWIPNSLFPLFITIPAQVDLHPEFGYLWSLFGWDSFFPTESAARIFQELLFFHFSSWKFTVGNNTELELWIQSWIFTGKENLCKWALITPVTGSKPQIWIHLGCLAFCKLFFRIIHFTHLLTYKYIFINLDDIWVFY